MVDFQTAGLTSSRLLTALEFGAHLLLLHLCRFVKTTSAPIQHPRGNAAALAARRRFALLLQCVPYFVLWPIQKLSVRFFSVFLVFFGLQTAGDFCPSRLSPSAGSLAIALHQATPCAKRCPPALCFSTLLLALLRGRHRDLKPQVGRGNKTSFSAAIQS